MTQDPLSELYEIIRARAAQATDESYSAKLVAGGPALVGRKLSEEAVETLIAAMAGDDQEVIAEAGDVLYHLLALLVARKIPLSDVYEALERRRGQSGLAEKAARAVE